MVFKRLISLITALILLLSISNNLSAKTPEIGMVNRLKCILLHPLMKYYSPHYKTFIISEDKGVSQKSIEKHKKLDEYYRICAQGEEYLQNLNLKIERMRNENQPSDKIDEEVLNAFVLRNDMKKRKSELEKWFDDKEIIAKDYMHNTPEEKKRDVFQKIDEDIRKVSEKIRKEEKLLLVVDNSYRFFSRIPDRQMLFTIGFILPVSLKSNFYQELSEIYKNDKDQFNSIGLNDLENWIQLSSDIDSENLLQDLYDPVLMNGKDITLKVLSGILDLYEKRKEK